MMKYVYAETPGDAWRAHGYAPVHLWLAAIDAGVIRQVDSRGPGRAIVALLPRSTAWSLDFSISGLGRQWDKPHPPHGANKEATTLPPSTCWKTADRR